MERPFAIQIRVIFLGGEAWQDRLVKDWTRAGHPIVDWEGKDLIVKPGEWRTA